MLRAFRPIPYSKQCSPCLLAQPPLASGRCRRLCFFSAGSFHWACNLWVLIIYFSSWLCYLLWFQVSPDSPVRVFPGVWKLLFFKTPFPGQISVPTSFVSLFIFYIFSYFLSKTMGCFSGCLVSSAGIQKLFGGIYSAFKCSFDEFVGEKVVSPSYSSAILGLPPTTTSLSIHLSMDT